MTIREYMALRVKEDLAILQSIGARIERMKRQAMPKVILSASEQAFERIAFHLRIYHLTGIYCRLGLAEVSKFVDVRSASGAYRKAQDLVLTHLDERLLKVVRDKHRGDSTPFYDEEDDTRLDLYGALIEEEIERLTRQPDFVDVLDDIDSRRYAVTHELRASIAVGGMWLAFGGWLIGSWFASLCDAPLIHLVGYLSVCVMGMWVGDKAARSA